MTTPSLNTSLTYNEYALIPPDGKRYEILQGGLHVTPAPSPLHQRVSKRLQRILEAKFEVAGQGEVFNAPIDVILTDQDIVQPDLVLVTNSVQISARGIEGPPFLLVEVLSPSTRNYDRTIKAERYATLGVLHYWIVDPELQTIDCYQCRNQTFSLAAHTQGANPLVHPEWPDWSITVTTLWSP